MKPDVDEYMASFQNHFRKRLLGYKNKVVREAMVEEYALMRDIIATLDYDEDEPLPGWADRILRGKGRGTRLSKRTRLMLTLFHNTLLKRRRLMRSKGILEDPTKMDIQLWSYDANEHFFDPQNPEVDHPYEPEFTTIEEFIEYERKEAHKAKENKENENNEHA